MAQIILRPGFREIEIGHIAQLCAAPLFAVSYLLTKFMTKNEEPVVIVGMLTIFVTIGLAPFALYNWVAPSLNEVIWLALVAVFATVGGGCGCSGVSKGTRGGVTGAFPVFRSGVGLFGAPRSRHVRAVDARRAARAARRARSSNWDGAEKVEMRGEGSIPSTSTRTPAA